MGEGDPHAVLNAAVVEALARLRFTVEHLDACVLVTPRSESPVVTALQVIHLPQAEAVLNLVAPLIRDPVVSAVARVCANNGEPWTLFGAAMFRVYAAIQADSIRVPTCAANSVVKSLASAIVSCASPAVKRSPSTATAAPRNGCRELLRPRAVLPTSNGNRASA